MSEPHILSAEPPVQLTRDADQPRSCIVASWHRSDPRGTVRLDGYYFIRTLAREVADYERSQGRFAFLLVVEPGQPDIEIPNRLFYEPADEAPPSRAPIAQRERAPRVLGKPRILSCDEATDY